MSPSHVTTSTVKKAMPTITPRRALMNVAHDIRRPRSGAGVDAISQQDTFDRIASDLVAKVLQGADDPRVPPTLVLLGHPDDEGRDLGRRLRPPLPSLFAAVVLLGHQLSVPTQNRLGRRDCGHCRQPLPCRLCGILSSHATAWSPPSLASCPDRLWLSARPDRA